MTMDHSFPASPPLIIGATGGSGTRVVARMVRRLGVFIGANLNESEDTAELFEFYDRWINRFALRDIAPLCSEEEHLLRRDFSECVRRHHGANSPVSNLWGWKEPRSIYLLPLFFSIWPEMKFIHVIRDGRDMALSANQNQPRKHGGAVLRELAQVSPQVRAARLWARVNLDAAGFCREHLQDRYLVVRFEDICTEPQQWSAEIARFLGVAHPDIDECAAEVTPPQSIGRWRNEEPSMLSLITDATQQALTAFGYESVPAHPLHHVQ